MPWGRCYLGAHGPVGGEIGPTEDPTMVVWPCSDAAANVNGRTYYVGGDEIAYAQPIGPA